MAVEVKNGWIFAVRQLEDQIAAISVPDATETVAGVVKQAEHTAVPASFADVDAVKDYLDDLVAALVASGVMASGV